MSMTALDTETTGVDFCHGARPFLVTFCTADGDQLYWEWDVDPLTRQPLVPPEDLLHISQEIADATELVLQNAKFDYRALETLGTDPQYSPLAGWAWDKVHDTLLMAHLLESNLPKALDDLAERHLGRNIRPYEKNLETAVQAARRLARSRFPDWAIAKEGREDMPSATQKTWKFDSWLPRAVCKQATVEYAAWVDEVGSKAPALLESAKTRPWHADYAQPGHPWWTVTSEYANQDSAVTAALGAVMMQRVRRRGLELLYHERRKIVRIAAGMESRGVTVNCDRFRLLRAEYGDESERLGQQCKDIATRLGYDLQLPKGASPNKSLREFCFGPLGLPPVARSAKTGEPSLDKSVLEHYAATLGVQYEGQAPDLTADPGEQVHELVQRDFVQALMAKRKRDTSLSYMESYERFWVQWVPAWPGSTNPNGSGWYVLHPSLNYTGTGTLRWSSSNPNEQNISKKGIDIVCRDCHGEGCPRCGHTGRVSYNLRYGFGPAPGRIWYSLDAANIELRIPFYESGEEEMIELFERPNDPPYYGSNHLLIFHTLHPGLWDAAVQEVGWDQAGPYCKNKYKDTWYQRVKNGNFAVQYGAVDRPDGRGTADRSYGIPGAQARIKQRFKKLEALNRRWIQYAEKHGYVETIPDKTVDPTRGYPLLCTRTEWGRILPTVPLNYHVQGTAMWWMMKAMIRCQQQLDRWNAEAGIPDLYYMALQVHDELVFDFPAGPGPQPWLFTLPKIRKIRKLMEQGGDDLGIPTPVSCEVHVESWKDGKAVV